MLIKQQDSYNSFISQLLVHIVSDQSLRLDLARFQKKLRVEPYQPR